jgi:predicted nucleotidyltransferase
MNQLRTIQKIKVALPELNGIYAAVLYGSFARKEANPNSDIDIQLLVSDEFAVSELKSLLERVFVGKIIRIQQIELRDKIVVYFTNQPKLEFAIHTELSDLKRNYLGSKIQDIDSSILFEKASHCISVSDYLKAISTNEKPKSHQDQITQQFVDKFIYEFENCSSMQRRSDGYQFYYFYNIALHTVVQLYQLAKGNERFIFLPKRFLPGLESDEERAKFYKMNGSLFLPEANNKKRILLDCFYESIDVLLPANIVQEIKVFCEFIFERDFFWNFRDPSENNPKLKAGKIYRTATLTFFQNEPRFQNLLDSRQIKTIIDLRADREIAESAYNENVLSEINYVSTPWDPWNQPDWFKEKYHFGNNADIAYRFFILGCKDQIQKAMRAILESEGAVAVHCFAGKDRTGIFFSLLHLLVGCEKDDLHNDYLASETDVAIGRLIQVLEIIEEHGGIEKYLISCGLDDNEVLQLKNILSHEY